MSKDDLSLSQLVQSYQLFNRASGKSPNTVSWYEARLGMFLDYLGTDPRLRDLTTDTARSYIVHLQTRNDRFAGNPYIEQPHGRLSTAYIHGCVRSIRAFANWLYMEGYTDVHRLQAVKPPKVQQKVIAILKDEEVQALLGCFDHGDPLGARNYAAVYTLLDTGLRASELCGLTLADVHFREGFLKVLGKGNKERLVPFGMATQAALQRWRDQFRPLFEPRGDAFFLNANGEPMTVNALGEMLERAGRRSGVARVHPHLLRHTFATNYLAKGVGDAFRLQQVLGHTSLEMVRHYVQRADIQQSLLDRRASPMDLFATTTASPMQRRVQPRRPPRGEVVRLNDGQPHRSYAASRGRSGR